MDDEDGAPVSNGARVGFIIILECLSTEMGDGSWEVGCGWLVGIEDGEGVRWIVLGEVGAVVVMTSGGWVGLFVEAIVRVVQEIMWVRGLDVLVEEGGGLC